MCIFSISFDISNAFYDDGYVLSGINNSNVIIKCVWNIK